MAQRHPIGLESTRAAALSRRLFVAGASAAVFVSGSLSRFASAHGASKRGPKRPTCVAITDNGAQAVTSDDEGNLKVRAVPINIKEKPQAATKKHQHKASFVAVRGSNAVTAGYDGLVILHDLKNLNAADPPVLNTHSHWFAKPEVWVATLASDGYTVLLGTNDGQIMLWDSRGGNDPKHVRRFRYSRDPVAGLAFVPGTNDELFLSTHAGVINLWRKSDLFEPLNTYSHKNKDHVNAVALSADGSTFASASFDRSVRLWQVHRNHVDDPKPLQVLKGHTNIVWRVAMASDARGAALRVASAGEDAVRAWRLSDGQPATPMDPGKYGSMGVAFRGLDEVVFTRDGSDPNTPVGVATLQFRKRE